MFNSWTLFYIVLFTTIIFSWLFRYKDKKARIFFLFFAGMYLIYSGIGGALDDVDSSYVFYYVVFTLFISIGVFIGLKSKHKNKVPQKDWSFFLDYFINKYATYIITLYYIICISTLIYPENKIMNLISPPRPDVIAMLVERYQEDGPDTFTQIINLIKQIIYPFFIFSLYKYRSQILKLSIIVVGTYYIQYCQNSYLGRGSMLEAALIILAFSYFYVPKIRKPLLISIIVLLPTIIIFLVQYSLTRIGGTVSDVGFAESFETLIRQESGYPLHFDNIMDMETKYRLNFLVWLFTIPLPGFFRFGIDANFNALFSEELLHINRESYGFYILLPGIVGESVFLMGKYLFWINGLFYGWLMGITYRILARYPQLFGILVIAAIDFGYVSNRGGLSSGLPFILKILVYFYFILLLIKKGSHWDIAISQNKR